MNVSALVLACLAAPITQETIEGAVLSPGSTIEGEISNADREADPPPTQAPTPLPIIAKSILMRVSETGSYRIDLRSLEFDAYLVLTDSHGTILAENDDGGADLDARLEGTLPAGTEFRIQVCALHGERGRFSLSMHPVEAKQDDSSSRRQKDVDVARDRYRVALERYGPGDHPDIARAQNNLGLRLGDIGDVEGALAAYQDALEMRKRLYPSGHRELAQSHINVAASLDALGRLTEALSNIERADELLRDDPDRNLEFISLLMRRSSILLGLGRAHDALPVLEEALAFRRRTHPDDDTSVAKIMNGLASCLEELGRPTEALKMYERTLEMRRRIHGPDHRAVGYSLSNLGKCLESLGRRDEALLMFEASVSIMMKEYEEAHPDLIGALNNLAFCLESLERIPEAVPIHERVLEMWKEMGYREHPLLALSLNNFASCHRALGRIEVALALYEQALEMYQRLDEAERPETPLIMTNLASCLSTLGRHDEALRQQEEALSLTRRLRQNDHLTVAATLGNLSNCYQNLERWEEALQASDSALELLNGMFDGSHPEVARHGSQRARSLLRLGRVSEALAAAEAALALARRFDVPDLQHYAVRVGLIYLSLNRENEAVPLLAEAIARIETRRSAATSLIEQDRAVYFERLRWQNPYDLMVRAQRAMGRPDQALRYLEQGRGRVILDLLHRARFDPLAEASRVARQRGDDELQARLEQGSRDVSFTSRRLRLASHEMALLGQRGEAEDPVVKNRLAELEVERDSALEANQQALRTRAQLVQNHVPLGRPASPGKLRQLPRKHELLLFFSFGEKQGALFVIPPAGDGAIEVHDLALGERQLESHVLQLLENWQVSNAAVERGRAASSDGSQGFDPENSLKLFAELFPIAAWQQIREASRVLLIPDGAMHRLPVEALVVHLEGGNPTYWIDAGPAVSYAPSGTVLLACRDNRDSRRRSRMPLEILALGDPTFRSPVAADESHVASAHRTRSGGLRSSARLDPLPGTRREVSALFASFAGKAMSAEALASVRDVQILLGEDANESLLYRNAPRARRLHLASHYLADETEFFTNSALALTMPREASVEDDGFLTVGDLLEKWRGRLDGCELVVLSACQTAAGRLQKDDGLFAMPWGLFYAGVPAVIVSHWQVNDESTAELMADFYRRLMSDPRPEALDAFTAARRALRKQYPSPFHWAPFVYLGDPR